MNLYLIGISGSGKSTTGKILAKLMNKKFIDTDREIEKTTGMKIHDIFNKKGEKFFRKLEKDIVSKVSLEDNCIVSLGGGAVTVKEVRNIIKKKVYG